MSRRSGRSARSEQPSQHPLCLLSVNLAPGAIVDLATFGHGVGQTLVVPPAVGLGSRVTGKTYHGTAGIRTWLDRSAGEYTYTIELIGAEKIDDEHYTAINHLEGDFPGGVVDLHFQFTLRDGRIARLVIEA